MLFSSSKGYLAAGYTSIPWASDDKYEEDKEAFVLSLTNEMRVFLPNKPSSAVNHYSNWEPNFFWELGFGVIRLLIAFNRSIGLGFAFPMKD